MNAQKFEQHAREDTQLRALINEVAVDAAKRIAIEEDQKGQRFVTVTGVDILFSVAAYALYRVIKDCLDHRRALLESDILKQRAGTLKVLIEEGFPPEQAQAVVIALSDNIAKRTADDPVLTSALAFLRKIDSR